MNRIARLAVYWVLLGIIIRMPIGEQLVFAAQGTFADRQMHASYFGQSLEKAGLASRSSTYETIFSLDMGLRRDNLDWSIAGNTSGTSPNILSELEWSDVDSYQLALKNRTRVGRHLYFRSYFNYAVIQRGRLRDSDYAGNDRTAEYSRSISQTSDDQLWDFSFGAGYPFVFLGGRLMVAPLLGASVHKQNFRMTDGNQVVTWLRGPDLGPFQGLNSTYKARWEGVWGGCDLRYRMTPNWKKTINPMELGLSVELHQARYTAEANWNLRNDLQHPVSFEHDADGIGYILAGEWLIHLAPRWGLDFQINYQRWTTDSGTDRVYFIDGVSATRLNEVNWDSRSLLLGVTYTF